MSPAPMTTMDRERWRLLIASAVQASASIGGGPDLHRRAKGCRQAVFPDQAEATGCLFCALIKTAEAFATGHAVLRIKLAPALKVLAETASAILEPPPEADAASMPAYRRFRADIDG